jgi:hypothetical protein
MFAWLQRFLAAVISSRFTLSCNCTTETCDNDRIFPQTPSTKHQTQRRACLCHRPAGDDILDGSWIALRTDSNVIDQFVLADITTLTIVPVLLVIGVCALTDTGFAEQHLSPTRLFRRERRIGSIHVIPFSPTADHSL